MSDSLQSPASPPGSMRFPRQEYWSGLQFPSPGDLSNPGFEPWSPALQADPLPLSPRDQYVCVCVCVCVYSYFPSHLGHLRALSRPSCAIP